MYESGSGFGNSPAVLAEVFDVEVGRGDHAVGNPCVSGRTNCLKADAARLYKGAQPELHGDDVACALPASGIRIFFKESKSAHLRTRVHDAGIGAWVL